MTDQAKNRVAVLIDGVEFESVGKAAEYLEVFPAILSKALKTTQTLKGFNVQYKNPEAKNRKHRISVLLTNPVTHTQHKFDSCVAAAKFLGVDSTAITGALREGRQYVKGFKLERTTPTLSKNCLGGPVKSLIHTKAGVKVIASNGTTFKSIKQSAAYLNMPSWELVHALRNEGQYVKNGITYTPATPARTRNMQKAVEEIPEVVEVKEEPKVEQTAISGIQLAKNLLKDRVSEYVKSDNFKMAKELMDVIEQIKE